MDRRRKNTNTSESGASVSVPLRSRSLTPQQSPHRALTPDSPRKHSQSRVPDARPKTQGGAKVAFVIFIALLLLAAALGVAQKQLSPGPGNATTLTRRSVRESFGAVFSPTRQLVKIEPYSPAQTARLSRYVGQYIITINNVHIGSYDDVKLALQNAGKDVSFVFQKDVPPEAEEKVEEREAVIVYALGQPVRVARAVRVNGKSITVGSKGIVMAVTGGRHDTHVAEVEVDGIRFFAKEGDIEEFEVDRLSRSRPQSDTRPATAVDTVDVAANTDAAAADDQLSFAFRGTAIDTIFRQIPFLWNDLPVFTDTAGRFLYASRKGKWMIGRDKNSVRLDRGSCRSHAPHNGALPHTVGEWDVVTQGNVWVPVQITIQPYGKNGELLPSQQVGGRVDEEEFFGESKQTADQRQAQTDEQQQEEGQAQVRGRDDATPTPVVEGETNAGETNVGGEQEEVGQVAEEGADKDEAATGGEQVEVVATSTPAVEPKAPELPAPTPQPEVRAVEEEKVDVVVAEVDTPVPPTPRPLTPTPLTPAPPTPTPPTPVPPTPVPAVEAKIECLLDPYAPAPRMFIRWGAKMSVFELQVKGWNNLPVWKDEVGNTLFSSNGGKWMIGGEGANEANKGTFVSAVPHEKRRPQGMTHWQTLDAHGRWVPAEFHLNCDSHYPQRTEHGVGTKFASKRPEYITFTSEMWASTFKLEKMLWLGMPVWKNGLGMKLFNTNGGFWMVGDPVQNKGFVKTEEKNTKRRMPNRFDAWEIIGMAGAENRWSSFDCAVEAWDALEYKGLFRGDLDADDVDEHKVDFRLLKFLDAGTETWECALGEQYGEIGVASSWLEEAKALPHKMRFKSTLRRADLDAPSLAGYKTLKAAVFRDPVSRFMARLAAGHISCRGNTVDLKFFDLSPEERAECAGTNNDLYVRMLADVPADAQVSAADLEKARAVLTKLDYVSHLASQDQALYMIKSDLGLTMTGYPQCWQKTHKLVPTDAQKEVVEQMNVWDAKLMLDVKAMFASRWESVMEQGTYAASTCSKNSKLCFHRRDPLNKVGGESPELADLRQRVGDNEIVCAQHCAWGEPGLAV